ncbi:DUF1996 domain-containing protein [Dactylosporangium aurantiacum]|uniref:DUF1996 domain-containing protein n=1 Tax=Dactylosporangium aurantiacum TaxID=35754 RepID=A0A9Q9MEN3_9ACTN|nr:DUF1996 domain-containing protein [Dactylosporangium aurantiacum]MDG6102202.1 DUF1996 domain-containing protein [Dactylosporangium aurantiacum]UWZ53484.1 DUF1996 domain-containing protein [Dactylosporangium aurantiacum]
MSRLRRAAGVLAVALAGVTVTAVTMADAATTVVVQAEAYAAQSGVQVETTVDTGGGQNVAYLANGDWMRFDGVDLGPAGGVTVTARVASATGSGTVELRTGSVSGPLLAQFPIAPTGGWQAWTTLSATGTHATAGPQAVFAVVRAGSGADFVNINWFSFTGVGGSGTPSASASGTGWVRVDQAKWNAQLAAFNALPMDPAPADAVRVPEFNASCTYSHSRKDDPIVFPGLPGASHMHSFIGNRSTDANSTTDTLLANAGTSCAPAPDLSAYWVPTLYEHGQPVEPKAVVVYYGSRLTDSSRTVPFPQGFRMIAGDAKLQAPTPAGTVNQFYCAGPGGEAGRSADGNWPRCAPGASLLFQLVFQDCWDGVHLDSPTHKGHVAYTNDGTCPAAFPVAIPSVSFVIAYPTPGSADGFTLSSGMASSFHGDAFLAWDNTALGKRVKNCVVQRAKCNTAGTF